MSTRQNKVAKQIQKDIAEILQQHVQSFAPGKMLTVTSVRITPDLSLAKILISVFPSEKGNEYINNLNANISIYRNELSKRLRHQLRKMPEMVFYLDDSLDYLENIDKLLKD
jgi:ribosome-binding factor A